MKIKHAYDPASSYIHPQLVEIAGTAPHECIDPACPGNQNRRKLAAFEAMEAALDDIAKGMMPTEVLNKVLDLAKSDLAEARGEIYGWCQTRARAALKAAEEAK